MGVSLEATGIATFPWLSAKSSASLITDSFIASALPKIPPLSSRKIRYVAGESLVTPGLLTHPDVTEAIRTMKPAMVEGDLPKFICHVMYPYTLGNGSQLIP